MVAALSKRLRERAALWGHTSDREHLSYYTVFDADLDERAADQIDASCGALEEARKELITARDHSSYRGRTDFTARIDAALTKISAALAKAEGR